MPSDYIVRIRCLKHNQLDLKTEQVQTLLAFSPKKGLRHLTFNRHWRLSTSKRCWKLTFLPPITLYRVLGLFTDCKSCVIKKDSNLSALLLCFLKLSFMTTKHQAVWSWVWLVVAQCCRPCCRACSSCYSLPSSPGRARLREKSKDVGLQAQKQASSN